jgi:uncharacterized membrane protein YbaN (DUF454 family)
VPTVRRGPARWALLAVGFTCVGLGGVGVIVPGLPTTGFFILAAACFSRSSPRFERWVLGLPGVGQMVRDHRAGLGMPRRAKGVAVGCIAVFAGLSATLALDGWWRVAVLVLAAIGIGYVGWRVPTKERVLAARQAAGSNLVA